MLRFTIRRSGLGGRSLFSEAQVGASRRIAKNSRVHNSERRRFGAVFVRPDSEEAQAP